MRRRTVRHNTIPSQNLDSFLDILTNTVGVLMFIGLFVSLLAVEAGTIIRTPLRTQTIKVGKFFELRNNRIFYINDPYIEKQVETAVANLPKCYQPDIPENIPSGMYDFYLAQIRKYERCVLDRNKELSRFYVSNDDYAVSFLENGSIKYQPIFAAQGENSQQVQDDNSEFNNILKTLDPNVNFIAFIVRPDSFPLFRTVRAEANSHGFEVGWEPFQQNRLLIFGSGGRSIGVQ
jgi:hypothetical protein